MWRKSWGLRVFSSSHVINIVEHVGEPCDHNYKYKCSSINLFPSMLLRLGHPSLQFLSLSPSYSPISSIHTYMYLHYAMKQCVSSLCIQNAIFLKNLNSTTLKAKMSYYQE